MHCEKKLGCRESTCVMRSAMFFLPILHNYQVYKGYNFFYSLFVLDFLPKDKKPPRLSLLGDTFAALVDFFFFQACWILVAAFSADKKEGGRNAGNKRFTFFWYSLYVGYFPAVICSVNAVDP